MSDNTNNGFPVPEEPLTREEEYLSAIAGVTASTEIPEKPLTRVEAYLNKIVENGGGGGGGGFTPTDAQLDAMNSGITSEDVEQISTNKNNISAVTMGTQTTGDIDLNAVTTNSYKMYTNTTSNLPTSDGTWYFVKTTVFDNNTMLQEATAMNAGAKTYTRIKRSGNWQAWKLSNLDSTQEAAINSGINDTLVGQITTNQTNISTVQTSLEVGQNDNGKVLTAAYSGGTGSYSWVTPTALKSYTISKPSDGSVSTATFDWSQLANGTYLISCQNHTSPTTRYGISIYAFVKIDDTSLELWTPISDITSAKITSYVVSDNTLTLTYDVQGYHTVKIVDFNI